MEIQSSCMAAKADIKKIQAAVVAAEGKTSAEFVVALEPQSGHYRDLDLWAGIAAAGFMLLFTIFSPLWFHTLLLPVYLMAVFGVVWFASGRLQGIRRFLASEERFLSQTREAAELLFMRKGISQTRGRTGVLVMVSQLERRIEVVADSGVVRAVDQEEWDTLMAGVQGEFEESDRAATAIRVVERLGEFLKEPLPVAPDDEDELRNMPCLH